MKKITLSDNYLGHNISSCIDKAKDTAIKEIATVNFEFNGINVIVHERTDVELLLRDYSTAWDMNWKEIGPDCVAEYSAELKGQIEENKRVTDEKRKEQQAETDKKDAIEKEAFDKTVDGIVMEFKDKDTWDKGLAKNQDPYGNCCYVYADGWAKIMQSEISKGRSVQECAEEASYKLGFLGITGFMYGAAVSILSHCWIHGEELRKWHNKEYNHEGDGVVNPAIMTISV